MTKQTSWGGVADWYDDVVNGQDSYQKNVLMPNIIRIVNPQKGMAIFDVACGQGYFSRAFASNGSTVVASDISGELVRIAQQIKTPAVEYHVASADSAPFLKDGSMDVVVIILAMQNIENMAGVVSEANRVLKTGGRFVMVINHPAFRIPQKSDWGWDDKSSKQYRKIFSYMSDDSIKIDMTPGEKIIPKKKFTISFHRPLQSYFKALTKNNFAVIRLEEWISHKKSQNGPRAIEEDRSRKEIPMFVCIEAKKQ